MAIWRWLCKPWAEMSHLNFATVGHIFEALSGAQIMDTISRFKSWEVRSPELQTRCDLEVKWRSYGCLKTSAQSWARISQPRRHLEGCFAAAKPLFGTRVPFAAQFPSFRSCDTPAKSLLNFEMVAKWFPSFRMAAEMLQASKMVCENATLLRNDLQASEWLRKCSKLQKWFVNMPLFCENAPSFKNGL